MANKDLDIALRIRADLNQAKAAITNMERTLDNSGKAADRSSKKYNTASRSLDNMSKSARPLPALLTRIAGLLSVAFSVREIAQASEAYALIRNRLALVTDSSEELAAAQDTIFRIAQESRQPLTATAELYQRIATNADRLNLSAAGLEDIVSTINKTLAISGTSGASAEAALIQLGQAFASGTLRGEELNSVLEQAPGLAKAIADGLGVSVGELRSLGAEGRLTTDALVSALQKSADGVDAQFDKIQTTGGQALTVLGNSLTRVIGELDVATGSSAGFAESLTQISNWLDSGVLTDGILQSIELWGHLFDSIADGVDETGIDFDYLSTQGLSTSQFLAKAFIQIPINIKAAIQIATVEILAFIDRTIAYAQYAADMVKAAFDSETTDDAEAKLQQRLAESNDVRDSSIADILAERDAVLELSETEKKRRQEERASRAEARTAREKEIATLREQAKNAPINLKSGNDDEEKKRKKQLEDDQKQLAQLRARLLKAQGQEEAAISAEFEARYGEMLKRLRERGDKEGEQIVKDLMDLELLNARLSEAEKLIDKTLADQQQQESSINTQREAGLITQADAQRRIVELHQQTYEKLQSQRSVLEELSTKGGAVGEMAKNALAELDGQAQLLEATLDRLEATLRSGLESGLTDALSGLAKGTYTLREAIGALGQTVLDALIQMAAQDIAQSITTGLFGGGDDAAAKNSEAATKTTSAAAALGGAAVAWGIVATQIEVAAAALAATGGGGGGGVSTGGGSGYAGYAQMIANVFAADGGHITGPGTATSDSIPAMLSNNEFVTRAAVVSQPGALDFLHSFNRYGMSVIEHFSPAYHNTGGLAGVPAPAMPTPSMPASANDPSVDQGGEGRNLRIMNVVDPELVKDYLQSAQGDQVFVNWIKRNTSTSQRLLGIKG